MSNSSMSKEIKWRVVELPEQLRGSEIDPEKILSINVSGHVTIIINDTIFLPFSRYSFLVKSLKSCSWNQSNNELTALCNQQSGLIT